MKAEVILYSRSLTEDYRWIYIPNNFSESILKKLGEVYDYFDDNKHLFKQEFPPFFCISTKDRWLLLTIEKTDYTDAQGRKIYCMEGLSFHIKDTIDLGYFLPYIIEQYKNYLHVWKYVNYEELDKEAYSKLEINVSQKDLLEGATENLAKLRHMISMGINKNEINLYPITYYWTFLKIA